MIRLSPHLSKWLAALSVVVLAVHPASAINLGAALDNSNLVWQTSSPYPWYGTNNPSYDGISAAVSGNRYVDNSESWIQTTVVGPGTIGFWWKVSSDITDSLQFYVGENLQNQITGGVDWDYQTRAVPAGTNNLKRTYF